jgi:RNA polymerase sigma factor (sigma-70 family)
MGESGSRSTARRPGRLPRLALRTQPDERLVALVREGHDAAFEEIVRRYRAPLVRFAGTIVARDLAEDTVQEGLVRAHGALREGASEMALRAWLFTIVRNRAISELRRERPTQQLDETINGVAQPPDVFEGRERVRGVVAELKRLPDSQREAIVRTELEGASGTEVAAALGTTPGAVGQLVFRARTALRSAAAVLLPMPALRMLLTAPPGSGEGGAAAGGALAGALGGSGGAAVKVGTVVVAAAIAIGPGSVPLEDERERGDGTVEIESAEPSDRDSRGAADRAGRADGASGSGEGGGDGGHAPAHSADSGGGGGWAGDPAARGGENGGDGATSEDVTHTAAPGDGGDGAMGDGQQQPPPADGGDHGGHHDQPTGTAPPPGDDGHHDDGTYGGGDQQWDGHQPYDGDGGYGGEGGHDHGDGGRGGSDGHDAHHH